MDIIQAIFITVTTACVHRVRYRKLSVTSGEWSGNSASRQLSW